MAAIKSSRDGTLSLAPSLLLSASPHAHHAAPCPIVSLWRSLICICTGTHPATGPVSVLVSRWWQGCPTCCLLHPSTSLDLFPGRTLSSLSIRLIMRSLFHLLLHSPTATFLTLSFSPALALGISHMLFFHSCTHAPQPCGEISASDRPCSSWMHRLWCRCRPLMTQSPAHFSTRPQEISVWNIST